MMPGASETTLPIQTKAVLNGRYQHLCRAQLSGQQNTLTIGDSSTSGDVFDSFQFRGLKLASDPSMWPDSQRGFAPTVRGIAQSNAEVTIKQNGYIIYQTHVPAGSFEITDIYPTTSSGGLHVIIKEADGSERSFFQPFSSVPIMLRENMIRNEFTMGNIALREALTKSISFYRHRRFMALKMIKHSMVAPLFRKSTREFLPALAAAWGISAPSLPMSLTPKAD